MTLHCNTTRSIEVLHRAMTERSDGLCRIEDEEFYRISHFDQLEPFLMSIVSDTDLWMYVSSSGGLTAGRQNEDAALFPYETDDRLHRSCRTTGPFTLIRIASEDEEPVLWEPFAQHLGPAPVQRNLYKSVLGNQVIFEEINRSLGLTFRYSWRNSDQFGFVRTCRIESGRTTPVTVTVVDGCLNLLPAGAELVTQQRASCLIDAYTQCEADRTTGLGIFAMTSMITDKPKAADSLKANVVWSRGLPNACVLLSVDQLSAFVQGSQLTNETMLKGRRGAYLVSGEITLKPQGSSRWDLIADAARDQFAVEKLRGLLQSADDLVPAIEQSTRQGTLDLRRNLASADGLQCTADSLASQHHLANVLFNNMRGGVFADNGVVDGSDLLAFISQRNRSLTPVAEKFTQTQAAKQPVSQWISAAQGQNNPDLLRLCYEYLPITFSRRHGDPSRPWNRFFISVKDDQGKAILNYQGNWRDIFQNWEALCTSFPEFIESVVAKFLNASTIDGFNPYRITSEGIDWESPDPQDPWAHIGYWGDHQIVYLLRLLELSRRYHGHRLTGLLDSRLFSYANVPYHIKPYSDLLKDRRNTIDFDRPLDQRIAERVKQFGSDGKLLTDSEGQVLHVNLLEKLLVPLLSKLSNLIVDGGIWMNTQRPEWNDANNALVGNGISMVTLCYLRRYIALLQHLIAERGLEVSHISSGVSAWMGRIAKVLAENQKCLAEPKILDEARKDILDQLGAAFCDYRKAVYASGLAGSTTVKRNQIDALLASALEYLDHSIRANRRSDGLFHSYNLVRFSENGKALGIDRLPEMLEGQVAVLSSGLLGAGEAVETIQSLFDSALYRADQQSFMLYPDRKLPGFLDRNIVPAEGVISNPFLKDLLKAGDRSVVAQDKSGNYRFTGSPRNAGDVSAALDRLEQQPRWTAAVESHRQAVLDLYESVVSHSAFTGRSGTMYGYEGLGCIYWHMVSKLLLAVQECCFDAREKGAAASTVRLLADLYYKVRLGLSFNKSARVYGAFPLDPYSHTPGHRGAQQPGMSGQVKEEILTRLGELGARIHTGSIAFEPDLLRRSEFLTATQSWSCLDLSGAAREFALPAKSLGFTICQTPVVMSLGEEAKILIRLSDGRTQIFSGASLSAAVSQSVLSRSNEVGLIEVTLRPTSLLSDR